MICREKMKITYIKIKCTNLIDIGCKKLSRAKPRNPASGLLEWTILVCTPALGLYLCVFLCVHVTSNVELRNYVISRQNCY